MRSELRMQSILAVFFLFFLIPWFGGKKLRVKYFQVFGPKGLLVTSSEWNLVWRMYSEKTAYKGS